jgi:CRISPR-associated protein Cas2
MTVVITRDVAGRFRGFLSSCMLEVSPGVYTASRLNASSRDRIWSVLDDWYARFGGGAIVMIWEHPEAPSGQKVRVLGEPPVEIVDQQGVHLTYRPPAQADPFENDENERSDEPDHQTDETAAE